MTSANPQYGADKLKHGVLNANTQTERPEKRPSFLNVKKNKQTTDV